MAIGAVAALAWLAVVLARGGLVGGALLVLLAGTCFGYFFYNLPAGPVPLTADRALLVVVLAQYALYLRWGWIENKPLVKADYLLAAFLLLLAASTLTHDFGFNKSQPLAQFVFFFGMPGASYWLGKQMQLTARSAIWLFGVLAALGLYLGFTAVAETHQMWSLVFPKYIALPQYREFFGRGRGPLLNPAGNGILLGLGMCAAVMFWPRLPRVGKLLLLTLLPLYLYGVYSTFTRSAWMGAGLGLLIVAALSTPRHWRAAVLSTAILAGVVVAASSWEHLLVFKRDKEVSVEEMAESAKLRPILATVAWHMFLDRPLLGCGFGQYVPESRPYLADRTSDLPLEKARPYVQHNAFLAILTETGLVGVGLFVALLATWTQAAWRLWRSATSPDWVRQIGLLFLAFLGVYLPNANFHDVSIIPMVNMYLFFLGGTVVGLAAWPAAASEPPRLRLWCLEEEPLGAR